MKMRHLAAVIIFGSMLGLSVQGQETPAPAAQTTTDLQWMLGYRGKNTNDLEGDNRFQAFLHQSLPDIRDTPLVDGPDLYEAVIGYLTGPPNNVIIDDNRYLSASSCTPFFCEAKGLLWVDLGERPPFVVFAALYDKDHSWATPTLWMTSRVALTPQRLPKPLLQAVQTWVEQWGDTVDFVTGKPVKVRLSAVQIADPSGKTQTLSPTAIGLPSAE
jgi:hypothetical protein